MARITVRFSSFPLSGTMHDLFPHGAAIVDGWGRRAVADVQGKIWATSRFRRSTGKSTRAWKAEIDKAGLGLALTNAAENRYGTKYARYVHLAGRPKSDKLTFEVVAHVENVIGPQMLQALGRDFKAGLKKRRVVATQTFGGR